MNCKHARVENLITSQDRRFQKTSHCKGLTTFQTLSLIFYRDWTSVKHLKQVAGGATVTVTSAGNPVWYAVFRFGAAHGKGEEFDLITVSELKHLSVYM